jgi:transposase
LRIPLFVGTFSPQGEQVLRRFRKTLPKDLQGFLTDYEAGLEHAVSADPRYEFRLRATVELAPKDPDAVAIQFTHYVDMTDEERAAVEEIGRRGQVIVRDRKQSVSGLGRLMPKAAAAEVQEGLPYVFNQSHFTAAWKCLKPTRRRERGTLSTRILTGVSTTSQPVPTDSPAPS